jgi:hypothetical protein
LPLYQVSGEQLPISYPYITSANFSNENLILSVQGFIVDEVITVQSYEPLPGGLYNFAAAAKRVHEWIELATECGSIRYDESNETLIQAFRRTILTDRTLYLTEEDGTLRNIRPVRRLLTKETELKDRHVLDVALPSDPRSINNRAFFITKNGYMGLGYPAIEEGDVISVLMGGQVPFVLRPADNGLFLLIGEW